MNPISSILLRMSESPAWQRRITSWSVTRRVVSRFIPGEELDDAVAAARALNARGMAASLNPVGEHVHSEAEAAAAADSYVEILRRIDAEGLDSNVSVKLSLLGFDLSQQLCADHMERIVEAAGGRFVRIDMEDSSYVSGTLALYARLRERHTNVGVVIQSYLRRSAEDVDWLVRKGAAVRLVKGAYNEPPDVAFPDKADVDRNFAKLLERLMDDEARANGVALAVATHDPALAQRAQQIARERGIEPSGVEFQMLFGIARSLQDRILADGYPVRIYISYGKAWYPWFMRRLAERPANLGFFVRHLWG